MIKRIGISTGGGDAPGLNAVIRAVVRAGSLYYRWEVYGIEDGFDGLLQPDRLRIMTPKDVSGILPEAGLSWELSTAGILSSMSASWMGKK